VLEALGATVLHLPAIEVRPPRETGPLDEALRRLETFDWIAFTSANAVTAVADRLSALGRPAGAGAPLPRLAVVGEATADEVRRALGDAEVALQPESGGSAADLLAAWRRLGVRGARVLLPVSSRGRDELERGLVSEGAAVTRVVAYEVGAPPGLSAELDACLAAGPDLFVFASPSAGQGLMDAGRERLLGRPAVAIGPTTARALEEAGWHVAGVAASPSVEGLRAAVVQALRSPSA
jgi:uroporphyrinogen-III synthase